ncbi:catechol 2,3-dioxygenase-like lactoylglutathione lyase family enzyme [Marmoricola sp. URHA0025 HA25]
MSTTQMQSTTTINGPSSTTLAMRLEVVVIPIADYDRARSFYTGLGWRVDADIEGSGGYRLVQVTPPGSAASVIFGTQVTAAQAGSFDGLLLAVDDVDVAREALLERGVEVSEVFHDANGGLGGAFHVGDQGRAAGRDPERRSYASYASFEDSEGNRWILQEITTRLPGRVWEGDGDDVSHLADRLHETAERHDAFENVAPTHDWWDWYAAYLDARRHGADPDGAAQDAARYMAEVKHVVALGG